MSTLLVVGPHAKHLNSAFTIDDLINETVLNIDTAGICTAQIPDKFLERRRPSKGIVGEDPERLLGLWPETRESETRRVLLSLFCEDELPGRHQPGCFSH